MKTKTKLSEEQLRVIQTRAQQLAGEMLTLAQEHGFELRPVVVIEPDGTVKPKLRLIERESKTHSDFSTW